MAALMTLLHDVLTNASFLFYIVEAKRNLFLHIFLLCHILSLSGGTL